MGTKYQKSKNRSQMPKTSDPVSQDTSFYPKELTEYLEQHILTPEQQKKEKRARILGKVLDAFLNVGVVLIVSSIIAIHANQLQAKEVVIAEKNQQPNFQIEAIYEDERIRKFKLINSGGIIEHLDVQLERLIHVDTRGSMAFGDFFIPYNEVTAYFPVPGNTEFIDLYPKTEARGGVISPLDVKYFITELSDRLDEMNQGYLFQAVDIMTLSFTDFSRTRRTEKYILYSYTIDDKSIESSERNEYFLFPIDEETQRSIDAKIPEMFDRSYSGSDFSSILLPDEVYVYIESNKYFESRNFVVDRDRKLLETTISYISDMGFE